MNKAALNAARKANKPTFYAKTVIPLGKPDVKTQTSVVNANTPVTGANPGGSPGGNPYSGILSEFLNSSKARFAADSAADAASRDAALRRYIISYGQVPDFAKLGISDQTKGFLQGAINDKVTELANNNTKEGTSVYARTKAANDKAMRLIPAGLASRGMLFSGQTGADTREQNQAYKIQGFDQLNEMLGGIEGTVGNFLQAERARADALAQAELQAQMSAFENYGGDMYGDEPGADPTAPGPTSATPWLDKRKAQLAAQRKAAELRKKQLAAQRARSLQIMRQNELRRARAGRAT